MAQSFQGFSGAELANVVNEVGAGLPGLAFDELATALPSSE